MTRSVIESESLMNHEGRQNQYTTRIQAGPRDPRSGPPIDPTGSQSQATESHPTRLRATKQSTPHRPRPTGSRNHSRRAPLPAYSEGGSMVAQKTTGTPRLPGNSPSGARKPWVKKTPIEIVLSQIAKLREDIN